MSAPPFSLAFALARGLSAPSRRLIRLLATTPSQGLARLLLCAAAARGIVAALSSIAGGKTIATREPCRITPARNCRAKPTGLPRPFDFLQMTITRAQGDCKRNSMCW